jgi:hypothetical protein
MANGNKEHETHDNLFGIDCNLCVKQGIECHEVGIIDFAPGTYGETIIYIDNKPTLRTNDCIYQCDVTTRKTTIEDMAAKIREKTNT